jgi:DNA-binding response OmpR family regulator
VELEMRKAGANEVVTKGGEISELIDKAEKILKVDKDLFIEPSKERILLVIDDDEAIRGMLVQFFSKKKYKVFEAADGESGLSLMRQEKISCVLLDIQMPGMSGLDVLPKLLEIDPKAGVVMISGEGDEQNVKKAVALGAYGYVIKPFDFVYLELTVASKLAIAGNG